MRIAFKIIDTVNSRTGLWLRYLVFALVLVVTYDVIMRYIFNSATEWAYDIAVMLGGTIYILSWGYCHFRKSHIRVDIIYTFLTPRKKAIIDVIGTIILAFPLLTFFIAISFSEMMYAWRINEKWAETYWYPPMTPFKAMVFIAVCLFALQVMAQFARDVYLLVKKETL